LGCGWRLVCIEHVSQPLQLLPPEGADKVPEQLALPGAEECFRAVGLDALPVGASDLSRKQLEFCLAYLKTGSAVAAAKIAGYGDAQAHASKVMQQPKVAAFLGKVIAKVAGNADKLIERVWERSARLHEQLTELQAKPEGGRDFKKEVQLTDLANKTDTLLATILGKLIVNVQGNIGIFPAEQRAELIALQNELVAQLEGRKSA
jgi:hypothetical protein